MKNGGIAYLAFTERGRALAERLSAALGGEASCTRDGIGLREWTEDHFSAARALVYIGAAGIAVRAVAPHLASKASDPAVLAVDEGGRFAVPLASGHIGGANELARRVAELIGATVVVTTATDVNGVFAVDEWARAQGMAVVDPQEIKRVSAKLLNGETVTLHTAFPIEGAPPEGVELTDAADADVWVDIHSHAGLLLAPRVLRLGIGCKRGTTREKLEARFAAFCRVNDVIPDAICGAATIDLKKNEEGILDFCALHGWTLQTYSAAQLATLEGDFSASDFVKTTTGVDNICERAACMQGKILVKKDAEDGVTLALAQEDAFLDWRQCDGQGFCRGDRLR